MSSRQDIEIASDGLVRVGGFIDKRGVSNLHLLAQLMEHTEVLMALSVKECKRRGLKHADIPNVDAGMPIDQLCGEIAFHVFKKEYYISVILLSALTSRVTRIMSLPIDNQANHVVPVWVPCTKGKY